MNDLTVTTYLPKHTLVETEHALPEGFQIFLSEYGPYSVYSFAEVDKDNDIIEIVNYSPVEIDLAYKNFTDFTTGCEKQIISAHTLEGTHEDYVFFRVRYRGDNRMVWEQIELGINGRIGTRGGQTLDLGLHHDAEPFVKILWELYKLYTPTYDHPVRTTELYEKYVVRSKR